METGKLLKSGLSGLGIGPEEPLVTKALDYLSLICRWNRVTNLTAIREPGEIVTHHLLDAFSVQPFISGSRVLDVGSGAGLPGIPLALIDRDKDFILLDSNGKKTRFMTQVKIELDLPNVEVVQSRVEDYRGSFDQVISRAFSNLADMVSSCRHLLVAGGSMLAMKGPGVREEMADVAGCDMQLHELVVPGLDAERYLVRLRVN